MPTRSPFDLDSESAPSCEVATEMVGRRTSLPLRAGDARNRHFGMRRAIRTWTSLACLCVGTSLGCSGGLGAGDAEPSNEAQPDGANGSKGNADGPGTAGDAPGGSGSAGSQPGGMGSSAVDDGTDLGVADPAGPAGVTTPDGSSSPISIPVAAADCGSADVSPNVLRRLSRLEYQLTLQSLFQLSSRPEIDGVPRDSDFKGFRTLAALQNVTTEHLRGYQATAQQLATDLVADPARFDAVVGCELDAGGCLADFVARFGRLAYRRTLGDDEVNALLFVAEETGGTAEEQFVAVVTAMLSAPSFLFRVEVGDSPEGLSTLSGEELASRLAFTLTGRTPSSQLLDQGAAGALDTPEGLAAAARELLSDAKAQEYFNAFFQQWLGFEQLRAPNEPKPGWNDALMLSMTEETERFLDEYAWSSGANFLDSLVANHTYVRADLAEFYGLPAPPASGRVEFPEDHNRYNSGLLSHAALISAKGDGDKIAHRGSWVMKTFLCVELQVPTALLDALSDELEGLTYQQMLDKRNSESACSGCHSLIDPIGVGFSQYDAAGQFDSTVDIAQFGIDPALPGDEPAPFNTLGELAALIRQRPELAQCLTDRVFLYTDGREASASDRCTVAHATEQFAADGGRFASILEGLVLGPQFRLRRAPIVEN